jgi:hypothetical protein
MAEGALKIKPIARADAVNGTGCGFVFVDKGG